MKKFGLSLGWQGIVPSKVRQMGSDIADTLLNDLLDLKAVFSRVDSDVLSTLICPRIIIEADMIIKKEIFGTEEKELNEWNNNIYQKIVKNKTKSVIKRLIDTIKKDPEKFLDVKEMVVNDLIVDKSLIVSLFQKCGKNELQFIVYTGLIGGK